MRNKQIAIVGLTLLVALTGCSGLAGLSGGPMTFTAHKATVGQQTLSQTHFQTYDVQRKNVTKTFKAAGQSKKVTAVNWIAIYDQRLGLNTSASTRVAAFSVVSTPQANVLGKSFNPIANYDNTQLVELFQKNYGNIQDLRSQGNYTTTMLGHQTKVEEFSAKAAYKGHSADVYIHVTRVKDNGDFVLALAVYPQSMDSVEAGNVKSLIAGVQHGNASS